MCHDFFKYQLYNSGLKEGRLCELHNLRDSRFWYATLESGFCAEKLEDALSAHKTDGFACGVETPLKNGEVVWKLF